ncbi:gluconokinase [Athalassotoga saccharophila]|uniref:gluconokinase n=1 Tax=Athalassotoga saccharophila TaxID=1441386 RepID=UPI00137A58C9|nr:gluconokinase [Athalassotoga saccharophila]BBJ27249.1 gluconokinase [Athalassotoga saccharophila]
MDKLKLMRCLIGVDIGTTRTKVVAYDLEGRRIADAESRYTVRIPQKGWAEEDPDLIFRAILKNLKKVIEIVGNPEGISFSCAMHSLIPIDDRGEKLSNAIIWMDNRGSKISANLKNTQMGMEIYKRTGTPIHPMSPLLKILYMRERERETFEKTFKFISLKEYIFHKFFGSYLVDQSIASSTGLFNIRHRKWDMDVLDFAGIREDQLSYVVPTNYILKGNLYAKKIGIDPQIPFVIGGADGPLSNLGSNAIDPGIAALNAGTSGALRVVSSSPFIDPKMRLFTYILDEKNFVIGGAVNNVGVALDWFVRTFGGKIENLERMAEKIPAGSNGLIFLPHITGERTPYWNSEMNGSFLGIRIDHKRSDFFRAVLEGIAFSLYEIKETMEENGIEIKEVHLSGGMSSSKLFMEILGNLFKKIYIFKEDSSTFGAFLIGAKALGIDQKDLFRYEEFVPEKAEDYSRFFQIYKKNHQN